MIITTDHEAVRELRLNRPPVNALSVELLTALRIEVSQAASDGARAVVISGSGGIFSAGLDIPLLIDFDRAGIENLWRELYGLMRAIASSSIPIAAAITGHAPAGGTVIALFCDRRIAARGNFKLGLTEVQVGIPLPPVILSTLQRQVGPRTAERFAVAGLMISPDEALGAGLVDELADPEEVTNSAIAWCRGLLKLPKQAMLSTRRRARADVVKLFERGEDELSMVTEAWWSPETQNTLRAVVEGMRKKAR